MTLISFYLENGSITDVDLSSPELGNPGCGGTEYAVASLVRELSQNKDFVLTVYSQSKFFMENVNNVLVKDSVDAVEKAGKLNQIFIFRPHIHPNQLLLKKLEKSQLSAIAWLHVTPTYEHLNLLSQNPQIKALVAMSHRQYYGWLDSSITKKTVHIVNGQYPSRVNRKAVHNLTVTYLGALVPQKGFHLLAEAWPKILSRFPDARLNVIGSGQLYSRDNQLGELGFASTSYEKLITTLLSSTIDSVKFLGRVSNSTKDALISQTSVGVVNPSGLTENCPASALDFQSAGVPVVTARKNGLIDTIQDRKTGLLISSQRGLEKAILKLLEDPELNHHYGKEGSIYVEREFDFSYVCDSWKALFLSIEHNGLIRKLNPARPVSVKETYSYLNYVLGAFTKSYNFFPSCYRLVSAAKKNLKLIKRNF